MSDKTGWVLFFEFGEVTEQHFDLSICEVKNCKNSWWDTRTQFPFGEVNKIKILN
jgi:hypothetical protein